MKFLARTIKPAIKLAVLVAVLGLVNLVIINLVAADPRWPTPPPAPRAPEPVIETSIIPVQVPPTLGAASAVIQPIRQGFIPAIPPLNSTIFEVPDHLKVTVEAGSLDRTIQLAYVPLPVDAAPTQDPLLRLVRVFDLRSSDYLGQEVQPVLSRPFILEVPLNNLPGPAPDPSSLLLARYENGRWLPLVTSYFHDDETLVSRVIRTGRFAIVHDQLLN